MNYQEARVYLNELFKYGSVLGLENMRRLLDRLGNPQDGMKFVHIAGTNGKGSALAYLSTVLTCAGYRTGRYLSPHLFCYRERYQVDGEMISEEDLARILTKVVAVMDEMVTDGLERPTCFEVETAIMFLWFREMNCDVAVLETGLGGALDATNVVTSTVLEVIASISMDHMEVLGDTLGKIAGEKAGIIKPNTIVVSAKQEPEAEEVLKKVCQERHCDLRIVDNEKIRPISYSIEAQSFDYKDWNNVRINLAGAYQFKNASLVLEGIAALRELGFQITGEQAYEGMAKTAWKGRFTQIASNPIVILDGAHNEGAAKELRNSLELYFKGRKLYYIFGVFKDKDYQRVIELTAPLAHHIVAVETPDNPRALPVEELKKAVEQVNPSVECAYSIAAAVRKLRGEVNPEDIIVIFGSLSFLAEAEQAVRDEEQKHG